MAAADAKALIAKRRNDVERARNDGVAISYYTFQAWLDEINALI